MSGIGIVLFEYVDTPGAFQHVLEHVLASFFGELRLEFCVRNSLHFEVDADLRVPVARQEHYLGTS